MGILPQIQHIVVLMFENRSFDNVVGWLYDDVTRPLHNIPPVGKGERAYEGLHGLDLSRYRNELRGRPTPLSEPRLYCAFEPIKGARAWDVPQWDPHEDYEHVNVQLFNKADPSELDVQAKLRGAGPWAERAKPTEPDAGGKTRGEEPSMTGFLQDFASNWSSWSESNQDAMKQIMETYTPDQLPILNGLARRYAICDMWFSSVPSQTNPNRAFLLCGTSLGKASNENALADEKFWTPTIFNKLDSWGLFYHHYWLNHLVSYTEYTFPEVARAPNAARSIFGVDEFYRRARAGELPDFSFIEAAWFEFPGSTPFPQFGTGNDYHPPGNTQNGERLLGRVYDALKTNRTAWEKTLLVVTFDEHGGTFDHYPPPWGAAIPDIRSDPSDPDHGYGFRFNRFGVRVPTLLISPWIEEGTVFRSTTGTPYDHASLIATVERWRPPNAIPPNPQDPLDDLRRQPISSDRVKSAPLFDNVLTRTTPRVDAQPVAGDPVRFDEAFYLRHESGAHVTASESGLQFYACIGETGRVRLKFLGGIGEVQNGAKLQIQSMEDWLGRYDVLGAWDAQWCYYYYTNGYAQQDWVITRLGGDGPSIRYGDKFILLNQNPSYLGYSLARNGGYLTTKTLVESWVVEPMAAASEAKAVQFEQAFVLRNKAFDYVISAQQGVPPWSYPYPRTGNTGAIGLRFRGGTGTVQDRALLHIASDEKALGANNLLGAFQDAKDCYYWGDTGEAQSWRIVKTSASGDGTIRFGDEVYLENQNPKYPGWRLFTDGGFLTTKAGAEVTWVIEEAP